MNPNSKFLNFLLRNETRRNWDLTARLLQQSDPLFSSGDILVLRKRISDYGPRPVVEVKQFLRPSDATIEGEYVVSVTSDVNEVIMYQGSGRCCAQLGWNKTNIVEPGEVRATYQTRIPKVRLETQFGKTWRSADIAMQAYDSSVVTSVAFADFPPIVR